MELFTAGVVFGAGVLLGVAGMAIVVNAGIELLNRSLEVLSRKMAAAAERNRTRAMLKRRQAERDNAH